MYWFKYAAFTATGIPVVWVIVLGVPDWWPSVVRRSFEAQSIVAAPVLLLLLCACLSRFADAGSTAVGLRGRTLRESAPSLGSSPDYAVLFRLAGLQSVALIILTLTLATLNAAKATQLVLMMVTFVSACAVIQNLFLFLGHSSLPRRPELPHDDREFVREFPWHPRRPRGYTNLEAFSYSQNVWEFNALSRLLDLVAIVAAVLGATALLLFSFFFVWPGRLGLLAALFVGSVALVIIGRVEGHASRQEIAALRREEETKRRLQEYEQIILRGGRSKDPSGRL